MENEEKKYKRRYTKAQIAGFKKISEARKREAENPSELRIKSRKVQAETLKRKWEEDEEFVRKICKLRNSKEYKKKRSKIAKKLWKNSNFRKKVVKILGKVLGNPELRKKRSELLKKKHREHPEMREHLRREHLSKKKSKQYKVVHKERERNYGGVVIDKNLQND